MLLRSLKEARFGDAYLSFCYSSFCTISTVFDVHGLIVCMRL